jgi:hypothetical protein
MGKFFFSCFVIDINLKIFFIHIVLYIKFEAFNTDQPIHGGDHQTFEMKKTVIRPFVSHLLDPSNSLTPKIDYSTCFLSSYK